MAFWTESKQKEEPKEEKKPVVVAGPFESKDQADAVKDKMNDNPKMQEMNVQTKTVDRNPYASHRVETNSRPGNQGRPIKKKSLVSRLLGGY